VKHRRLAASSGRDSAWQLAEYKKAMGKEAAERQRLASAKERGDCTCRRRTLRTRGEYRTIHERSCSKWKEWMEEYESRAVRRTRYDGGTESGVQPVPEPGGEQ
jgi:hypothetical protein